MKTNNILKALAFALLITTACNKSEIANDENTEKKGFSFPVTVNVTREGDDATKATYNESTRKLEFSAGDKLFVSGSATGAGSFAGALDYVPATGKFSGTIYTQKGYDGTADALFSAASSVRANLLPNGYDSYNFLYINNKNTDVLYDDVVGATISKAFVASETAKKTGVEQLSWEQAYTYSSGFALAPANAVLNFTISGLEAGEKAVTLITKYSGMDFDQTMSGSVTPNASGVATFAIGVPNNLVIKNVANNLTIGSSNFTLPGNTPLAVGKIYNITRSTLTYPIALSAVTSSYVGSVVTTDGNVYVTVADATAASKTAVAKIIYVTSTGDGLALALEDEGQMDWNTAVSTCSGKTPTISGTTWKLASQTEWNNMITAAGSYTALRDGFSSLGGTNMNAGTYWSSTDAGTLYGVQLKNGYKFNQGSWGTFGSTYGQNTRACLAF